MPAGRTSSAPAPEPAPPSPAAPRRPRRARRRRPRARRRRRPVARAPRRRRRPRRARARARPRRRRRTSFAGWSSWLVASGTCAAARDGAQARDLHAREVDVVQRREQHVQRVAPRRARRWGPGHPERHLDERRVAAAGARGALAGPPGLPGRLPGELSGGRPRRRVVDPVAVDVAHAPRQHARRRDLEHASSSSSTATPRPCRSAAHGAARSAAARPRAAPRLGLVEERLQHVVVGRCRRPRAR